MLRMTLGDQVKRFKNNIEETRDNLNDLGEPFWTMVSYEHDLTIRYMKEFKDYLKWDRVVQYNQNLTVEIMEDIYKPLYDKGLLDQFSEPFAIILLNQDLNEDVIGWLIRTSNKIDGLRTSCRFAEKSDLFWDNIFQNINLPEDFKKTYARINIEGELSVGDKVRRVFSHDRGIVKGYENDKYVIETLTGETYFEYREFIYKGWEE